MQILHVRLMVLSDILHPSEDIVFGREGKPRDKGLTFATDRMEPLDKDFLGQASEYIDCIKIGLSYPLLLERAKLLERIRFYHNLGISVQSGGTLVQVAYRKRILPKVLDRLHSLGFDIVEISESATEIPREAKEQLITAIDRFSMSYIFEVGKSDPSHSVPINYLASKIEEALELKSSRVIIEAGAGYGVGTYGPKGEVMWDGLNELVGKFGPPKLIFEAPLASQRTSLLLEFGPNVNIASVPVCEILPLEMQRQGLSIETLGVSTAVQNVRGSPAAKFVYHLIKAEHPIDQPSLMQRSGLPKRTLQAALSYLVEKGFIREVLDMSDLRRHKYTPR